MSDVQETPVTETTGADSVPETPAAPPVIEVVRFEREFHVGGTVIQENDATVGKSNEDVRDILKHSFPEVANATVRATDKDGKTIVEFLPQAGRKG